MPKTEYIQDYKEKGICTTCGTEPSVPGKTNCDGCRSYYRDAYHKRKSEGRCAKCGGVPIDNRFHCETCLLKSRAKYTLGSTAKWVLMKELWDVQKGLCPYTGLIMTFDESALDHLIPKNKGGTDAPENLQYTLYEVNRMKSDLSEESFLKIVKQIHDHCKSNPKWTHIFN